MGIPPLPKIHTVRRLKTFSRYILSWKHTLSGVDTLSVGIFELKKRLCGMLNKFLENTLPGIHINAL